MTEASGPLVPRMAAIGESIFVTMSRLSMAHGAINLGQGFPDDAPPEAIVTAAQAALAAGHHQYPPARGIPRLRQAIAEHQRRRYGLTVDPETEVVVTTGATGALSAAVLGLVQPGDEVVLIEPFYDAYPADVALAGGTVRTVPLRFPELRLDIEALRETVSDATRAIIINNPLNPVGTVFSRTELEAISQVAIAHDVVVISDEVYEHMTFDGRTHIPIASLPGMWERTLTISSAGKSFSVTGWKVGWASGPAPLVEAVAFVSQWLTFSGGTPMQHAVAEALERAEELIAPLLASLDRRRRRLVEGLHEVGLAPLVPEGTYFVAADVAPLGIEDADAWCRGLPERAGVTAVPVGAFCRAPTTAPTLARFAFCKSDEAITEGLARLRSAL